MASYGPLFRRVSYLTTNSSGFSLGPRNNAASANKFLGGQTLIILSFGSLLVPRRFVPSERNQLQAAPSEVRISSWKNRAMNITVNVVLVAAIMTA